MKPRTKCILTFLAGLAFILAGVRCAAQPVPMLRWELPPAEATGVVVRISRDLIKWVTYTRDNTWPSNEISTRLDRGFYQVAYQTVTGLCSIRCWLELPRAMNATMSAAAPLQSPKSKVVNFKTGKLSTPQLARARATPPPPMPRVKT